MCTESQTSPTQTTVSFQPLAVRCPCGVAWDSFGTSVFVDASCCEEQWILWNGFREVRRIEEPAAHKVSGVLCDGSFGRPFRLAAPPTAALDVSLSPHLCSCMFEDGGDDKECVEWPQRRGQTASGGRRRSRPAVSFPRQPPATRREKTSEKRTAGHDRHSCIDLSRNYVALQRMRRVGAGSDALFRAAGRCAHRRAATASAPLVSHRSPTRHRVSLAQIHRLRAVGPVQKGGKAVKRAA